MAKLLDFKTPTGQSGNILQPMTWVPLILGGVVLLSTFSLAQRLGGAIGNKLPFVDTTPNSPWQAPPAPSSSNKVYIGVQ